MKYCTHCGKEIMDEAVVCPGCGCAINKKESTAAVQKNNASAATVNSSSLETTNQMEIMPLLFGILAVAILYPLGIPSIILAITSKKKTGGVMSGAAKIGFICGIIAISIWAIKLLLLYLDREGILYIHGRFFYDITHYLGLYYLG